MYNASVCMSICICNVLCPGFKNPSLPLKVPGYTLLFHSRPSVF